jgi:hypothetical protein
MDERTDAAAGGNIADVAHAFSAIAARPHAAVRA